MDIQTYSEVFTQKVIVLMEEQPCSDKYHQVIFSEDEFKNLTKFLFDSAEKCDDPDCTFPEDHAKFMLDEDTIDLPGLSQFYEEE